MADNLKYADAMKELEQIVSKLQNPNCDVDELCSLTAKAIELPTVAESLSTSAVKLSRKSSID